MSKRVFGVAVLVAALVTGSSAHAAPTDYYIRLGGTGTESGADWDNALPSIDAAWETMDGENNDGYNFYVEKTTGAQSHGHVANNNYDRLYNDELKLNHYGGLTPTGTTSYVKNPGDVTRVVSTDPDEPAFRVSKRIAVGEPYYGVGGYYCRSFHVRFDDMVIEGGDNMGAVLFNAVAGNHNHVSLTANRAQFIGGASNTTLPVVAISPMASTPGESATASRADIIMDRVLVYRGEIGIQAQAKAGGSNKGDSVYDLKNVAVVNTGSYGLYAKGNNYSGWDTDADVTLDHVTFNDCDVAVRIGDAADDTSPFTQNTLTMNHVLVFLDNEAGGYVIRHEEQDAGRDLLVTGGLNAFFGYLGVTNGTDYIDLTGYAAYVEDASGDPGLGADGYHLVGSSDARIIDAYIGGTLLYDIDGEVRMMGKGWDIGADELLPPPVPEPAALSLLGLAMLGLRRKRR